MRRFILPAILAACTSCVACSRDDANRAHSTTPTERSGPVELDADAPLTLSMGIDGRFAKGYSWNLSVNAIGEARLFIPFPDNARVEFDVSDGQVAQLRDAVLREGFFEFGDSYGQCVPDGSTRHITIAIGEHTKTVKLLFLGETGSQDLRNLREAQRPVRLWLLVRDWFEHPQAVDLRPYDESFLAQMAEGN